MRENRDQSNSEYEHFLRSVSLRNRMFWLSLSRLRKWDEDGVKTIESSTWKDEEKNKVILQAMKLPLIIQRFLVVLNTTFVWNSNRLESIQNAAVHNRQKFFCLPYGKYFLPSQERERWPTNVDSLKLRETQPSLSFTSKSNQLEKKVARAELMLTNFLVEHISSASTSDYLWILIHETFSWN